MITVIGMTFYLVAKYTDQFTDGGSQPSQSQNELIDLHQIAQNPQLLDD